MADGDPNNLTQLTVDLLGAYVANNQVQHGDLAQLIQSTHAALKGIDAGEPPVPEEPEHKPAVTLRKSLGSKTHIISMIDGKPYQTLKRHLSKHDLTPEQYRERYGLPKSYPMVAPAYSEARRAIAEKLGLGRKIKGAQDATPVEAKPIKAAKPAMKATPAADAPKRVGRPRKAEATPAATGKDGATKAPRASSAPAKTPATKTAKPRATPANSASPDTGAPIAATKAAPAKGKPKATRTPRSKAAPATTA